MRGRKWKSSKRIRRSVTVRRVGYLANSNYLPVLRPYDLTRGGTDYYFFGHTDVKELALYAEDQIKTGNWLFNLGIRGDLYNGLAIARQAEPRLGGAYQGSEPTPYCELPMRARWRRRLMKTWCFPARAAPMLFCHRFSPAVRECRER